MYRADGIGRKGHRLLALALLAIGGLGLALAVRETGTPSGYLLVGLAAAALAVLLLSISLFVMHRPPKVAEAKPKAAKVPTPPLEPTRPDGTLFEYGNEDDGFDLTPNDGFQGTVPRATVVDERPPPPPVPDQVRTRHDFTAKYTQKSPMVREAITHAGPPRPKHVVAQLADPSMHPKHLPPRTMRGKCGDCDTLLLAPTQRPIELECPSCARVTLLE